MALIAVVPGCDVLRSAQNGVDTPVSPGDPGMDQVRAQDLSPEAQETLALIANNGPFSYSRDGVIFHNYEGLLPAKADGYYREYTVKTPGADDRGARRIVAGKEGERYYTDDHYNSFRLVVK